MTEGSDCPQCGSRGLPLVYGDPTPEMREEAQAGRVALGGCALDGGAPRWTCRSCGASWQALELTKVEPASRGVWDDLDDAATVGADGPAAGTSGLLGPDVEGWREQIQPLLRHWDELRPPPSPPWSEPDARVKMRQMQEAQRRLADQGLWLGGDRNLLQVLGMTHDELAHTRLLAWLVRPDGHHRAGRAALLALGAAALSPDNLLSGSVRVALEEQRPTVDPRDGEPPTTRADLVVRTLRATLLVEAKLDALEQPGQLDRLRRTWAGEAGLHVLLIGRSSHQQVTSVGGGRWPATSWAKLAEGVAQRAPSPRTAELDAVLHIFEGTV